MKFCITHTAKIRDVVEAEDKEQALRLFRAKYPATLDKEATLVDIEELQPDRKATLADIRGVLTGLATGYDYVNEQLQRLVPVDEYGIQIKLTTTTGETKWMTLTKENYQEHLSKIVSAVQKAMS